MQNIVFLKLLNENAMNKLTFKEIVQKVKDAEESLKVLEYYGLLDKQGEEIEITELGKIFLTFVENAPERAEEYIENWNDVSRIDEIEEEISEEEKAPWEL